VKILWITKTNPFRGKGGEYLYSAGMITALSENSEVKLVCFADHNSTKIEQNAHSSNTIEITADLRSDFSSLFSIFPNNSNRYWRPKFRDVVIDLIGEYQPHAVVIDSLAMAWLISYVEKFRHRASIIYFSHNYETGLRKSIAADRDATWIARAIRILDSAKTSRLERKICREADLITAITRTDLRNYEEQFPQANCLLLLPGYTTIPANLRAFPKGRTVCIIGSFLWSTKRSNLLNFLEQSFDILHQNNITLKIIGNIQDEFKQQLLQQYPQLVVTGQVASIDDASAECRAGLLIDTIGGGFKLKALDYIFLGLPIFALPGCMHGLDLESETDFIERRDARSLVQALADLISSENMSQMRIAAFEKSKAKYSWQTSSNALYNFLQTKQQIE